jgi:hypothetical protein
MTLDPLVVQQALAAELGRHIEVREHAPAVQGWNRDLFATAVFEDQEDINRRVLARFSNACDKQFASLPGQQEEIVSYIARFFGAQRES